MADNSPRTELSYLPPSVPPANHGHTRAAWFTTGVVVLGSVVAGVAMCFAMVWLVWVGAAIVLVGALGGKVLSVAGYGQPRLGTTDPNERR
ncbi:HGxxPAAW family protein [Sanguibacter suaedae]|jgi:hypothetical protein|uniref:DUF3040 domain-containing protein n=1 Tax=Sanguibacter suaedae TaxID=2795737 RepID=A0A934IA08_9MICO|nr:HGxxPAAW family protein [Sanguibacter suaedae]MBI9114935.1 hypothetical protein [Sanguibacter suaedae]